MQTIILSFTKALLNNFVCIRKQVSRNSGNSISDPLYMEQRICTGNKLYIWRNVNKNISDAVMVTKQVNML